VFRVAKVPSTPEDPSIGFIAGLAELETDLGVGLHLGPDEYPARPFSPGDRLWERREDVR
jgi:hypothetical protein